MINGISGASSYYPIYQPYGQRAQGQNVQTQNVQRPGNLWTAQRAASPETPVQPVTPSPIVKGGATGNINNLGIPLREGIDPAEMAVRMRIQYGTEPTAAEKAAVAGAPANNGAEAVQKAAEEGKCQTCENRKYQDGSDDMSVSFQTPTRIDPANVASAVRGHEMEHVSHEQAKARQEDRKVVSQSVTLHTAICPECGKAYISGGTTRTTTMADNTPDYGAQQQDAQNQTRTPFAATA